MKTGRPRKPVSQKIAEGKRGHHPLDPDSEPQPLRGIPDRPAHLKGLGLKAWNFITNQLAEMDLDYQIDAMALEGACKAYQMAVDADNILAEEGLTMSVGEQGYLQQRPEVSISHNSWKRFRDFCSEFGMTPAARGRINMATPAKKEDDLAAILNAPRSDIPSAIQ